MRLYQGIIVNTQRRGKIRIHIMHLGIVDSSKCTNQMVTRLRDPLDVTRFDPKQRRMPPCDSLYTQLLVTAARLALTGQIAPITVF